MRKALLYPLAAVLSLPTTMALADFESTVLWNFDGGTIGEAVVSVEDTSGEITATPDGAGTVTYAAERTGGSGDSSVELAGNGFLRVPDALALTGHADGGRGFETLVIEAWIYPTIANQPATAQIVRKYDTPGAGTVGYEFFLRNDNRFGFAVYGHGGNSTVTSATDVLVTPNEWNHIVGEWDGSEGTISITVNGATANASANTTLLPRTSNYLAIGALLRPNNTTGQFFTGRVDDVSISGTMAPPLVEIARWDMEGTVGETPGPIDGALDQYLGFEATPDIQGSATLTYSSDVPTGSAGSTSLNFANAGTGDNDGALLVVADHPSLTGHFGDDTGWRAIELEMWVKPTELGRNMQLFRKTDTGELGLWLAIQANGTVRARLEDSSGTAVSQTTADPVTLDEWHHIRLGWDLNVLPNGGFNNFYIDVDGVITGTPNSPVTETFPDTETNLGIGGLVRVGNTSKGQYFAGLMERVILRAAPVTEGSLEAVPPTIVVSEDDLDFGTILRGTTADLSLTLANDGAEDLIISALDITGGDAGAYSLVSPPSLPLTIEPADAPVTITVQFAPLSSGTYDDAALDIESNDPDAATTSVALTGEALQGPVLSASVATLDFGSVEAGTSVQDTFTITNDGDQDLVISAIDLDGADAGVYSIVSPDTFPVTITPTDSPVTVTVSFSPATTGDYNDAEVVISSNDPDEPEAGVALEGQSHANVEEWLLLHDQ